MRTGRAVLVAISIPIFSSQLEKSRDSVSVANIRAAYAEAQTAALTETSDANNGVTYTAGAQSGTFTVTVANVVIKSQRVDADWSGQAKDLPFTAPADPGKSGKVILTFTYADDALTDVTMSDPA